MVEFSKFVVFFGVDDDPEVHELLADAIARKTNMLTVDQILTILVNFAHTLSAESQDVFASANQEFA